MLEATAIWVSLPELSSRRVSGIGDRSPRAATAADAEFRSAPALLPSRCPIDQEIIQPSGQPEFATRSNAVACRGRTMSALGRRISILRRNGRVGAARPMRARCVVSPSKLTQPLLEPGFFRLHFLSELGLTSSCSFHSSAIDIEFKWLPVTIPSDAFLRSRGAGIRWWTVIQFDCLLTSCYTRAGAEGHCPPGQCAVGRRGDGGRERSRSTAVKAANRNRETCDDETDDLAWRHCLVIHACRPGRGAACNQQSGLVRPDRSERKLPERRPRATPTPATAGGVPTIHMVTGDAIVTSAVIVMTANRWDRPI